MQSQRLQPYFLLVLLAVSFTLAFFIFRPFLLPLSLAAIFAVVLYPVYARLLSRVKWEGVAALLTMLVGIVCILIPLGFVGFQIFREAQQLYVSLTAGDGGAHLESFIREAQNILARIAPILGGLSFDLSASLNSYAQTALSWFIEHLGSAFSSIAKTLLSFLVFIIAFYYLLRDGEKLKQAIIFLSPLADADDRSVFDRLKRAVNSVIRGNLAIALIQGTLTAIGFTIFGIPNSVLWGSVAAIAALIPGVGTSLVLIPGVVFLFITGAYPQGAGLLLWGVLAVGLVDNFLGPKLVGRGMKLHPLIVLLSVLGGIAFFGPAGIFLGPLSISLLFAFLDIYSYTLKPE